MVCGGRDEAIKVARLDRWSDSSYVAIIFVASDWSESVQWSTLAPMPSAPCMDDKSVLEWGARPFMSGTSVTHTDMFSAYKPD